MKRVLMKIRQESVILHADKDMEGLVEPGPNQTKVEENMNRELIKLIESTQNSEKNLIGREKASMKKGKETTNDKQGGDGKLYLNKRKEHQILFQATTTPELIQLKSQSTQLDDLKDSKTNSQMRTLRALFRKCQSDVGKHCKNNNSEEIRESVGRNQSREEEPSTLVGIASIDRDDAPSAITSVRTNLISKRRGLSKGIHTKWKPVKKP
uniref:Bm10061 n=1 Tax=Brugia malayi TaxID=6279 RepID=A0A0I9N843_BRUMA|nr:Bm10061 [Brugia malayi]